MIKCKLLEEGRDRKRRKLFKKKPIGTGTNIAEKTTFCPNKGANISFRQNRIVVS